VVTTGARVAAGQSELPAAPVAEGLFQQAKASLAAGQVAEACAKFQESQHLDPALGTLLNLALCHERQGKLASAWSELTDAAAMAERSGQLDRLRFARGALAKLEGKVPQMLIRVAKRAPDLELRIDGQSIGQAAWGSPIPLDPGIHRLDATAPHKQPWARSFEIVAGASPVTLEVPALVAAPEPAGSTPPSPDTNASPKTLSEAPLLSSAPPAAIHDPRRTWGYAAGALGIVGVAAGTYFGFTTIAKQNIVEENCNAASCRNQTGMDADRAAHRAATVADVSFGIGLAAVIASAYLLLTADDAPAPIPIRHIEASTLFPAPEAGPRAARVEVSFVF